MLHNLIAWCTCALLGCAEQVQTSAVSSDRVSLGLVIKLIILRF